MEFEPDPRFIQGIDRFNKQDFFGAHEAWEAVWIDCRDPSRRFYQGLIQVAVCLHHFSRRNTRGARKLYHSSGKYLETYRPRCQGIDLDRLLDDLRICCAEILTGDEPSGTAPLAPDLLPRIEFVPPDPTRTGGRV